MKPAKKRIWVFAALFFAIVALTALLLHLNQRPEPLVSAFLTKLHTVEDPASVGRLYEETALKLEQKMEQDGADSVVTLAENENPLYAYYSAQYASYCTGDGFGRMLANRAFDRYGKAALEQNWELRAGVPILDSHTENQFGYTIDVTVTNLATGEQKTVPQRGIIRIKRTLFGYKVVSIQMQSTDLVNPQPKLF